MKRDMKLWHVDASDKPDEASHRRNLNIWIFASTFDEAYKKMRVEYPNANIFKIMGERYSNDVLVGD